MQNADEAKTLYFPPNLTPKEKAQWVAFWKDRHKDDKKLEPKLKPKPDSIS